MNDVFESILTYVCKIQYTIEEKVIERAYKKLALDALVIQQGRLAEQKSKCIFILRVTRLHFNSN